MPSDPHAWATQFVSSRRDRSRPPSAADVLKALGGQPLERAEVLTCVADVLTTDGSLRAAFGPPRWRAVRPLYQAALAAAPDRQGPVLTAWSLGALTCVTVAPDTVSPKDLEALRQEALTVGRRAVAVADSADAWHAVGLAHYEAAEDELADALAAFEAACSRDPQDVWPRLYRAHCLQDLERWDEAAAAYATLSPGDFDALRAWRWVAAQELRAECLLRAGRREEALVAYGLVLDRFEAAWAAQQAGGTPDDEPEQPDLLADEELLAELPELAARVEALVARLG